MGETFKLAYYWLDLAVGFGAPLLLILLWRLGVVGKRSLRLFALGVLVGFTWEAPIFIGSCTTTSLATITFSRPFPLPWAVYMISHSLWDGSLFLLGCWIVRALTKPPWFKSWSVAQFGIFLVYGQLQELAVELSSTGSDGWVFIQHWWNPTLFFFNGHPITLFPQVFWLYGSTVYYLLLLKLGNRIDE